MLKYTQIKNKIDTVYILSLQLWTCLFTKGLTNAEIVALINTLQDTVSFLNSAIGYLKLRIARREACTLQKS